MQRNIDQRQEPLTQSEYEGYAGYSGSVQQPPPAYNSQQREQQQSFYQPAKGFEQPPFPPAPSLSGTSIAAILSYFLGWFSGLLIFLFAGQNRYVRFHALQSLLFFGIINVLDIAIISFESIRWLRIPFPYISGFGVLFFILINVVACIGWLVGIISAARGRYYRLPFVGDLAARCLNQEATVK